MLYRFRNSLSFLAVIVTGVVIAGFSPVAAQTVDVSIPGFNFSPASITIEVGTTVRWTNNHNTVHTTTSDDGLWDSGDLSPGESFSYTFNSPGSFGYDCTYHPFMTGTVNVISTTDAQGDIDTRIPQEYDLSQNYPNPFNSGTRIDYSLPTGSQVIITVYSVIGTETAVILNSTMPAGNYSIFWDGTDDAGNSVASGIYFYQIKAGDFVNSRKMVLLK